MKRISIASLILCIVCAVAAPKLYADSMFFGLGAAANANTRQGVAAGGAFSFGIDVNRHLAIGYKTAYSNDFDTMSVIERAALIRWYIPLQTRGLFMQAELGSSVFFENGESYPAFLSGAALGWRFSLGGNMFIEPTVRGGYPFVWGAGITAGFSFPISPGAVRNEQGE